MVNTLFLNNDNRTAFTLALRAAAYCFVGLIPILAVQNVNAEENTASTGIKAIQQQALQFAQQTLGSNEPHSRIEFEATTVDPRLKLSSCESPLSFEPQNMPLGSGRVLIKTRCESDNGWSIYIPLYKNHWQRSVVTSKPISRNTTITANDIALKEIKLGNTRNTTYTQPDDVIGLVSLRNLKSGVALQANQLAQPKWIKRGDQVSIIAQTNGIKVSMTGTALSDGRSNEQIRVKNDRSGRVIKAKVVGPGVVKAVI